MMGRDGAVRKSVADETSELIDLTARGDAVARQLLLARHRGRLRLAVLARLGRHPDPHRVVEEILAEANRRLGGYLRDRPLPFYSWLRRIATERIGEIDRRPGAPGGGASREGPDRSGAARDRGRRRLRRALESLGEADREILSMRHRERMEVAEIAAALAIGEAEVRVLHLRAVRRLRDFFEGPI